MRYLKYTYWLLPLFLIIPQTIYTFHSMNQIRMEEVIESFRSVWFFENRLVWNGSYSNLGWAALQGLAYQLFGFHFFLAKYLKLFLELISFFCLAAVLKKYLGVKSAWLPLFVISLSPTFLYFNSLQMSHGTDISFFIICLYLFSTLNFKKPKVVLILKQVLISALAMFAWLVYGGFIFYLVILALIYLYKLFIQNRELSNSFKLKNLMLMLLGFLLPLYFFYSYIENKQVLINDPLSHKGIFRSYGSIEVQSDVLTDNYYRLWSDLFVRGVSYYFEPEFVEFSGLYPLLTIIFITFITIIIFIQEKRKRPALIFFALLFALSLILVGIAGPKSLGGMRRGTVLLLLFYGLYALVWDWCTRGIRGVRGIWGIRGVCLVLLLLLPLHHVLVFPANLENLAQKSRFREHWWFDTNENPEKITSDLVKELQKTDVILPCLGRDLENGYCKGLSLIYPQIVLACKHNNLKCNNVYTLDPRFDKPLKLDINYWGRGTHVEP